MNSPFGKMCKENYQPIRIFTSVYHDYAVTYGSASRVNIETFDRFVLEWARMLNWGTQPIIEGCYKVDLVVLFMINVTYYLLIFG